jgi:hypothetical protein
MMVAVALLDLAFVLVPRIHGALTGSSGREVRTCYFRK